MDIINKATNSTSHHTEDQKQHLYNNLPAEERQKKTYFEWVREAYQDQYEKWMPWLEDQYLKWFGKGDNKASYVAKDTLNKSKIAGIPQVDQLQTDANNLIGNQLGENGLAAPISNFASKEGINRAERQGKDEKCSYGGPVAGYTDSIINMTKNGGEHVGNSISSGIKNAGNYMGLDQNNKNKS